ncbi:Acid-sensing ion channel 1 [Amphibalanus amphitrite]|uniref:Acid-sensing ion channel 1 n=1 Tax=Amphibalanus amphitrite TaxID=1232801 RepID=A0A6A4X849_AMPAM|nr:Acid-sensing ion channel 1 [Amphibalanus amphitrite]
MFELEMRGSSTYCYELLLHGSEEFWGSPVAGMDTYQVTNDTTLTEVLVTVDREVRPNLRRAPCEADPAYSVTDCQRRCFFDWLHCRMEEEDNPNDSRPLCRGGEAFPYDFFKWLDVYARFSAATGAPNGPNHHCQCPEPCVTDRHGFQLRPSTIPSSAEILRLSVRFEDVRRVMETYVTYAAPDLLADVGGYLGLLLGWSLLSVFSSAQAMAHNVCRKVCCRRCGKASH